MRTYFATLIAVFFALPLTAFAANLSVYPASVTLKKGDSVGFVVHLQSKNDINTLGADVQLPPGLAFLSVSEGNIVTEWIEHPTFNAVGNSVTFAGIMQNGWMGDGSVATIKVAAKESGTYSLLFNKDQTEVYKNDGQATPEPVVYGAMVIPLWATQGAEITGFILVVLILIGLWLRRKYKITFV